MRDTSAPHLAELQAAAGDGFDLSLLARRAQQLEVLASRLNDRASNADGKTTEMINAALRAVSRALVPVDYTEKDRFTQDPALAQQPYPGLQPIRRFASLDPESDEAKFLHVGMMRAHNRVAVALADAIVPSKPASLALNPRQSVWLRNRILSDHVARREDCIRHRRCRPSGRAIARTFLREGARVVVADRDLAQARTGAEALDAPDRTAAVAGDISEKADVIRMVHEATELLGLPLTS